MNTDPNFNLPDDVAALKAMVLASNAKMAEAQAKAIEAQAKAIEAQTKAIEAQTKVTAATRRADELAGRVEKLDGQLAKVSAELLKLRKMVYGPRADRFTTIEQVDQLPLEFAQDLCERPINPEDVPQEDRAAIVEAGKEARTARVSRRGRRDLKSKEYEHLPERRVEHDLAPDQKKCPCCGEQRCKVSSHESMVLEYIPGHFERITHVQHIYACKACDLDGQGAQMVTSPLATGAKVFDRALPGPGLLAYLASSKFSVYTPLNRLEELFGHDGVRITRGTMCVWLRDVAELLKPVYDLMVGRVKASKVVMTDDTVMPMQAPDKVKQARLWVYIGDEQNPYDVYHFTLSRSRDGPKEFLKGFTGTLVADAYGGYDGVVVDNHLTRAGCWAHTRRYFVDAQQSSPAIAQEAATLIAELFAIEATIKGAEAATRTRAREEQTRPQLAKIEQKLRQWQRELLPKHEMAKAVNYALNQWPELCVFASDQRVPIDNNASERDMKRVVLNRKNSLFVGNERGGETAAILSSLAATCKRHGVNPQKYLTQALVNVPHADKADLERWLPDRWKVWSQEQERAAVG